MSCLLRATDSASKISAVIMRLIDGPTWSGVYWLERDRSGVRLFMGRADLRADRTHSGEAHVSRVVARDL